MRIAIYGNSYQDQHLVELARFLQELAGLNVWVEMEASFFNYLCRALGEPPIVNDVIHGHDFSAALALSVGGDGTFLRTAGWVADKGIPILGINTGHLGYLAAVPVENALDMVKEVIDDRCRIESRSLLAVEIPGRAIDTWPYALNEVAILKDDTASMITVDAHIDQHPLATYMADGLIVSTPTGSTGYNLSVGGPIIEPTATNWVISPIAAHSLTMRPLVVNNQSVIELRTEARASQSYRVSLDGRSLTLPTGTPLRLSLAPFSIRVVQPHDHYFTSTLRKKLYWGVDPR
ncbi:MAG: NAD kinase [Bacteroidales bacterium]|nr:NAD kinase [Bacteroidales bacterium]